MAYDRCPLCGCKPCMCHFLRKKGSKDRKISIYDNAGVKDEKTGKCKRCGSWPCVCEQPDEYA